MHIAGVSRVSQHGHSRVSGAVRVKADEVDRSIEGGPRLIESVDQDSSLRFRVTWFFNRYKVRLPLPHRSDTAAAVVHATTSCSSTHE